MAAVMQAKEQGDVFKKESDILVAPLFTRTFCRFVYLYVSHIAGKKKTLQ